MFDRLRELRERFRLNDEEYQGQRFASKVLKFIAIWLTIFVAIVLIGFFVTGGMEPAQLVDSVFQVVGIELGGLLFKRVLDKRIPKNKQDNTQDNMEDEIEDEIYD